MRSPAAPGLHALQLPCLNVRRSVLRCRQGPYLHARLLGCGGLPGGPGQRRILLHGEPDMHDDAQHAPRSPTARRLPRQARYFHPPKEILLAAALGLALFQAPLLLYAIRAFQGHLSRQRKAGGMPAVRAHRR